MIADTESMDEWKVTLVGDGERMVLQIPDGCGFEDGEEVFIRRIYMGAIQVTSRKGERRMLDHTFGSATEGFMADGRPEFVQSPRETFD